MRARLMAVVAAAVVLLVLLSTLVFDLSLERALLLAPVLVFAAGGVAGLAILWVKAAITNVKEPSDAGRTVDGPDGMDDSALPAPSGAHTRGGDRP